MIEVNSKNFDAEVLKSKLPVVIDFWAEWCGPCRFYSPIIEEVSKEYDGKAKFCKLNTDESPEIAEKYGIMGIPTTMIFKSGEPIASSVGAVPKEVIKKWLDANLKSGL
ncbi:MAG: thioredoxin [Candidatus Micrarchaeaceae archaeon]